MMMKSIIRLIVPAWMLYGLSFGGDSSSTTENKQEVKDMRVVGGDGSSNVSAAEGSNVTVLSTDHSAVAGGLQLGSQAIDAATRQADGLRATTQQLYSGALDFASQSQQAVSAAYKDAAAKLDANYRDATDQVAGAYSHVASDLATAFTDSKAPDKSLLQVGGVIVVGLAAVMLLARRG